MKIVVFLPNLIGDTVMATPVLRALRRAYPGAALLGVVKPQVAATLDGNPWLDDLILFDAKARDRQHRTLAAWSRLRRERANLAVLLSNSLRPALLAWSAGVTRRIGYDRNGRGVLLTDRLTVVRDPKGRRVPVPAVDYYLAIVRRLGLRVDSTRLELATTPDDEAAADRAWSALGLPADAPVVCLNTGGAFGPAKSWPNAYFSTLARRLVTEAGVRVLVVCGPGEHASAEAIVAAADHPDVVSLAAQDLSLGLTKASIRRSALLITTDSGPRHFAAGFNVPVVSLFGPTNIAWTRTYHPHGLHLYRPLPCGPCQKPVCPLGHHRCMTELRPDEVFRAALTLLPARPRCRPGS